MSEGETNGTFLPLLDSGHYEAWGGLEEMLWEGLGCTASASLLLARCTMGKGLQREHTPDKILFPTRQDDRNGLSLSELWFCKRRRQTKPR